MRAFFYSFYSKVWVAILAAMVCVSCGTVRYEVQGGLSASLKDDNGIYPSVEVDVVAVTDSELAALKKAGVDKYFAPGSSVRQRLSPAVFYFDDNATASMKLDYRGPWWLEQEKKQPTTLAIIASLPHTEPPPSAPISPTKQDDPRMLFIKLEKHFFIETLYFEVEPYSVVQVYQPVDDPKQIKITDKDPNSDTKGAEDAI